MNRKVLTYLLAAAGMTLVIGCSMDRKGDGEEESQIIMADVATDNMVYGVLTETDRDSLLHIRTDDGDTLWVQLNTSDALLGQLVPGNRFAFHPTGRDRETTDFVVNLSMLMGQWVQPDPMAEGSYSGIELNDGGMAMAINSQTTNYEGWRLWEGKLLIYSTASGLDVSDQMVDTFTVTHLTADSLRLVNPECRFFFCRQSAVKSDAETLPYQDEEDNAGDYDLFNPEGDAPTAPTSDDGLMY